jgi:hypothetical protein
MDPLLSIGVSSGGTIGLAAMSLDGLLVYGLVVFVIGLIAWSKYTEKPLTDPYASGRPTGRTETAEIGAVRPTPTAAVGGSGDPSAVHDRH